MKNEKAKIERILEYEQELTKARNFYYEKIKKDATDKESFKSLDSLNSELRGVKKIRKILEI